MRSSRRREDCTPERVQAAMEFLCDEWLCDVATDYTGKCTIIAAALTLIERSLLPDRPASSSPPDAAAAARPPPPHADHGGYRGVADGGGMVDQ